MNTRRSLSTLGLLAALLALLVAPQPVEANDLDKVLAALRKARGAKERLRHVKQLVSVQGPRAAGALAKLVKDDPSVAVRVGAARALGFIQADNALDLLLELLRRGGPRALRRALAESVQRRPGGARRLLKVYGDRRTPRIERGLLLRACGAFTDAGTEEALKQALLDRDVTLRAEAVRALVRRAPTPGHKRTLLHGVMMAAREIDVILAALDAAGEPGVLDPFLRRGLERLGTFLQPQVREATDHLLLRLEAMKADAKPPKGGKPDARDPRDRYGGEGDRTPPTDGPPTEPPIRGQFDTVYVIDATGSTGAVLPELKRRILAQMKLLHDVAGSVRVGVLVYRGGRNASSIRRGFTYLPLTHDPERVRTFLEALDAGGVDDRGMLVGRVLEEALDRAGWRWRAQRTVQLYADTECGDIRLARRVVSSHFRADRTRTRIAYVLRSRTRLPAEYLDLARLGGSGAPELIE